MTARLLGNWPPHSTEWHAARADRIGGSDIGVICGWSPFKSRTQLLEEKRAGQPASRDTPALERGRHCEPAVLSWLAEHEGLTYDPAYEGTWADGWRLYNPDGVTTTGVLVEAKTCQQRTAEHGWGRAGTDQVPLCYAAQVQWGLGVLGLSDALLGVLSGAPQFAFARYRIRFDRAVFTYLVGQAEQFRADLQLQEAA